MEAAHNLQPTEPIQPTQPIQQTPPTPLVFALENTASSSIGMGRGGIAARTIRHFVNENKRALKMRLLNCMQSILDPLANSI